MKERTTKDLGLDDNNKKIYELEEEFNLEDLFNSDKKEVESIEKKKKDLEEQI